MSDATVPDDDLITRLAERLDEIDPRGYELVFYGLLLVWMAWLMITAWDWAWADKLVPLFAGVPTIALLLFKFVQIVSPETYDRFTPGTAEQYDESTDAEMELEETYQSVREEDDEVTRPRPEQIDYAIRMIVWAMGLPLLMYLIGFANALLAFVFLFGLRYFDSIRDTVVVTIVFSIMMYLFFWQIIGLNPWTGIVGIPSIVEVLGLG